jgi:hypothetical protein
MLNSLLVLLTGGAGGVVGDRRMLGTHQCWTAQGMKGEFTPLYDVDG